MLLAGTSSVWYGLRPHTVPTVPFSSLELSDQDHSSDVWNSCKGERLPFAWKRQKIRVVGKTGGIVWKSLSV